MYLRWINFYLRSTSMLHLPIHTHTHSTYIHGESSMVLDSSQIQISLRNWILLLFQYLPAISIRKKASPILSANLSWTRLLTEFCYIFKMLIKCKYPGPVGWHSRYRHLSDKSRNMGSIHRFHVKGKGLLSSDGQTDRYTHTHSHTQSL